MPSVSVARFTSDPDACAGAMRVSALARKVTTCSTCGPERRTTLYEMPGTIDVACPAAAPLVGTGVTAPTAGAVVTATAAIAAGIRARRKLTRSFKPEPRPSHEAVGRT